MADNIFRAISYNPAIFRCFVLISSLGPGACVYRLSSKLLGVSAFLSWTPSPSSLTFFIIYISCFSVRFSILDKRLFTTAKWSLRFVNRELTRVNDYHLIWVFTADQRTLWNALIWYEIEHFRGCILESHREKNAKSPHMNWLMF